MKLLYLTLLLFFAHTANVSAATIRAITNNGKWHHASTWNLNRKPQSGDTVIIPNNIVVVLETNESLNALVMTVAGTLKLSNGKLNLNAASRIHIMTGGTLTGSGNNDQVRIGGEFKFRGGFDLPVLGPAYADTSTGTSPNGFNAGLSILSELVTDFNVSRSNGKAYVGWSCVPANTVQFEVEKSTNGITWTTAGVVPAGGNRNLRQRYLYVDQNAGRATTYYRVKQVLPFGLTYTAVKTIEADENGGIDIYAASGRNINIRFHQPPSFPVKVTVTDLGGRVLQQESVERAASLLHVQRRFSTNGTVIVHVSDASFARFSRMLAW